MRGVYGVVLAVLCGCRSAHKAVFHPVVHDFLAQRMLDHRLLVLIETLSLGDVDCGNPNRWIVRLQERVLQLAVAIDRHVLPRYFAVFIDLSAATRRKLFSFTMDICVSPFCSALVAQRAEVETTWFFLPDAGETLLNSPAQAQESRVFVVKGLLLPIQRAGLV